MLASRDGFILARWWARTYGRGMDRHLLDLTVEYQKAVEAEADEWGIAAGRPVGRAPDEIAAEFDSALRAMLAA